MMHGPTVDGDIISAVKTGLVDIVAHKEASTLSLGELENREETCRPVSHSVEPSPVSQEVCFIDKVGSNAL